MSSLEPVPVPLPFAVDYAPGAGGPLVMVFSSIGHDPDRMPEPEFRQMATRGGRGALFVRDASRSWANAPEFDSVIQSALYHARARQNVTRIVALGVSMGAFSALAAAALLPVDAVLAIGPQFSINPAVIDEPRWHDHAQRVGTFRWPVCPLPARPWICLMHGLADDAVQAMSFPLQRGVDHILFDGIAHGALGPHLKQMGLQGLVDALVAGDRRRLLRIAAAAGGRRRQLPR
jgi:pimeloyl-ACP methyl ester carboxylesterase